MSDLIHAILAAAIICIGINGVLIAVALRRLNARFKQEREQAASVNSTPAPEPAPEMVAVARAIVRHQLEKDKPGREALRALIQARQAKRKARGIQ